MWCIAELNEEYIARMEDVLTIYEKPLSEREPVVCVDEKPVVLHADVRPPRPMRPGRIARRDSEYERRGTANVFCGVQPKAGRHFTKPHLVAHLSQQCGIAPGRIGHDVMQRLMHLANVTGCKTRCHGLNTLALQGQQQPLRVVFHRDNAIGVSAAARQLLQIIFKSLRPIERVRLPVLHGPRLAASAPAGQENRPEGIYSYNTVVLEAVS
jgi:hypothetical protein